MDYVIRIIIPAERNYCYTGSPQLDKLTGCIGHLRGDMDRSGKGFFTSWEDHCGELKTQAFKDEFDDFINALRFDERYDGIFKNRSSLSRYCYEHKESVFAEDFIPQYGFRVDTPEYAYLLRLNPMQGDYMRLLSSLAPDDENSKVSVCARNVYRIWAESTAQRSTQLVFCDLSTPKADGSFNVYDDLRQELLEMGIPENEIAYIHTANTEQKKKELFAKVRGGEVRILMGSTAKMGAGTNVQDRLIALHDLDCPWRPSDLQQRLGRIVRQGNQNPEVEIFRYVTEGTFDAYLYQLVESKQRFIAQIMTSKAPARAAEDVDETALSYAEIKALATGNPQIIEKCNLDMEVSKLNMLRANHLSQRYALEELVLRKYPAEIKELNERIAGYEQDSTHLAEHPKPAEGIAPMVLGGVIYTERENAGKAIIEACTHMNGAETVSIGSYRGFSMLLSYDGAANEFRMVLKGKLSHTAVLGADAGGNVTRIDNALEKITEHLANARSQLAHTTEQLENARTEMTAPFPKEAELAEKTRRLNELNVLLNLNEQDRPVMADEPDEGDRIRPKNAERER